MYILLALYAIQILLYINLIYRPNNRKLTFSKIFWYSFIAFTIIPILITFSGFYKVQQIGWCGNEQFKLINIFTILGNIGNVIIYIIVSTVKKIFLTLKNN